MKKNIVGFTLLELLVVIGIIGLLVTFAVASYAPVSRNARDSRRQGDVEEIRSAIELYRTNEGQYPSSPLNWGGTFCEPADCSGDKYMQRVPQDPQSPTKVYYYSSSGSEYVIGAALEGEVTACAPVVSCGSESCNYCLGPYGRY